jgi:hypothetical protein
MPAKNDNLKADSWPKGVAFAFSTASGAVILGVCKNYFPPPANFQNQISTIVSYILKHRTIKLFLCLFLLLVLISFAWWLVKMYQLVLLKLDTKIIETKTVRIKRGNELSNLLAKHPPLPVTPQIQPDLVNQTPQAVVTLPPKKNTASLPPNLPVEYSVEDAIRSHQTIPWINPGMAPMTRNKKLGDRNFYFKVSKALLGMTDADIAYRMTAAGCPTNELRVKRILRDAKTRLSKAEQCALATALIFPRQFTRLKSVREFKVTDLPVLEARIRWYDEQEIGGMHWGALLQVCKPLPRKKRFKMMLQAVKSFEEQRLKQVSDQMKAGE